MRFVTRPLAAGLFIASLLCRGRGYIGLVAVLATCQTQDAQRINATTLRTPSRADAFSTHDASNATEEGPQEGKSSALAIDEVVVALLNGKSSPQTIARTLTSLPGSTSLTGRRAPAATAVKEWPTYDFSYTMFPLGNAAATTWIAVYALDGREDQGHLSVFAQSAGRWRRTDGLDASNRLYAYPIGGVSVPTVVVTEHHPTADGWLGGLQVWSVNDGTLIRRGGRHEPLRFYEVHRAGEGLRVTYGEFAKCLGLSVSQLSLNSFELSVRAVDGVPVVRTRTTTPWLAAVDDACVVVHAGGRPAIEDTPSQAAGLRALAAKSVMLLNAEGNAGTGMGTVTVTSDSKRLFHIAVRRRPDDSWRIEKVTEGPAR